MSIGKYALAQTILDDHKIDIEKYFPQEHPAQCSVINNQAMLFKINGKYQQQEFIQTVDFVSYEVESQNGL